MKRIRNLHPSVLLLLGALLFGAMAMLCHRLLQNEEAYALVGRHVQTYQRVEHADGSWKACKVQEPFTAPTDSNMLSWDASHYNDIRQYLYSPDKMWAGYFAFFPLFPLMWRLAHVGPIGIAVLNYLLYAVGLAVMALLFRGSIPRWKFLLLLCAPMAVIYMIPYSEALFFITIALGLYGIVSRRYWLFFVGFFLGCTTRAAGNILAVAFVITDILIGLRNRDSITAMLRNILRHLAPVVAAVLAVVVVQHLRGAEHWFEYVLSQQYWGKGLSWPSWPFTDWSHEGAAVSQPLIFMLIVPALLWLALQLWHAVRHQGAEPVDERYMLRLLSVLFFVGNVVLAAFTQHGCFFSQARLLSCTPFFAFLVVDMAAGQWSRRWQLLLLLAMAVSAGVVCFMPYLPGRTVAGSWLVYMLAVLVFFGEQLPRWLRSPLLAVTIVLNIGWTAYLFNCFLTNGYVFT